MRFSSRSGSAGTLTLADPSAVLASGAQPGQVAFVTSENAVWMLLDSPASDINNWQQILGGSTVSGQFAAQALPDEVTALTEIPNLSPFLLSGM